MSDLVATIHVDRRRNVLVDVDHPAWTATARLDLGDGNQLSVDLSDPSRLLYLKANRSTEIGNALIDVFGLDLVTQEVAANTSCRWSRPIPSAVGVLLGQAAAIRRLEQLVDPDKRALWNVEMTIALAEVQVLEDRLALASTSRIDQARHTIERVAASHSRDDQVIARRLSDHLEFLVRCIHHEESPLPALPATASKSGRVPGGPGDARKLAGPSGPLVVFARLDLPAGMRLHADSRVEVTVDETQLTLVVHGVTLPANRVWVRASRLGDLDEAGEWIDTVVLVQDQDDTSTARATFDISGAGSIAADQIMLDVVNRSVPPVPADLIARGIQGEVALAVLEQLRNPDGDTPAAKTARERAAALAAWLGSAAWQGLSEYWPRVGNTNARFDFLRIVGLSSFDG